VRVELELEAAAAGGDQDRRAVEGRAVENTVIVEPFVKLFGACDAAPVRGV
jgi:hypothetical protein